MDAAAQRQPGEIASLRRHGIRTIRLATVALIAVGLGAVSDGWAASNTTPKDKLLQPLWQRYPLNPGAGQLSRPVAKPPHRPSPPSRPARAAHAQQGGGSSVLVPLTVAGGTVLLMALAAFLVIQSRRTPLLATEGARMVGFRSKRRGPAPVDAAPAPADEPISAEAPRGGESLAATEGEAPATDGEPAEAVVERDPAAEAAVGGPSEALEREASLPVDTGRVGEHVATVLQAAEQAAGRLMEEARQQAEQIRAAAERDAAARREAAEATAQRLEAEAERARAETLAASEEKRAAADADTSSMRAEAEQQAAEIRAAAERDASSLRDAAAARHRELLTDTALAEDRLRRLVAGLREVADRLDGLVGVGEPVAAAATDETREPRERTLLETLEQTRSTATASHQ